MEEASDDEGSEVAFDGVAAIHAGKLASGSRKTKVVPVAEAEEDDVAPVLLNREFSDLKSVLEEADVIVEVLDARDPLAYHSEHLEQLAKSKKRLWSL